MGDAREFLKGLIVKSIMESKEKAQEYVDSARKCLLENIELEQQLKKSEGELYQQRFNNKHNLSIDQTIADKITKLEAQLKTSMQIIEVQGEYIISEGGKHAMACIGQVEILRGEL